MKKWFRHFSKKNFIAHSTWLETQTHARNARGPGYSPRLEATVRTCTVHANLGPWVPGPWSLVPGSTEYSVPCHLIIASIAMSCPLCGLAQTWLTEFSSNSRGTVVIVGSNFFTIHVVTTLCVHYITATKYGDIYKLGFDELSLQPN